MSKQGLSKLNEQLLEHFKETGVKKAYYYAPFYDFYWGLKDKIGICNLEPYYVDSEKNPFDIKLVDPEVVIDYWYGAKTIQRTVKMFSLITKILDEDAVLTEKDVAECDNKNIDKAFGNDMGSSLYFNFRLTVGNQVKEDTKSLFEFYKDEFYRDYYRKFVKETELTMLIVTSETGCALINQIYPDLHLEFNGEPKLFENVLFCSCPHPSKISNKQIVDSLNKFFDCYFSMRKQSK